MIILVWLWKKRWLSLFGALNTKNLPAWFCVSSSSISEFGSKEGVPVLVNDTTTDELFTSSNDVTDLFNIPYRREVSNSIVQHDKESRQVPLVQLLAHSILWRSNGVKNFDEILLLIRKLLNLENDQVWVFDRKETLLNESRRNGFFHRFVFGEILLVFPDNFRNNINVQIDELKEKFELNSTICQWNSTVRTCDESGRSMVMWFDRWEKFSFSCWVVMKKLKKIRRSVKIVDFFVRDDDLVNAFLRNLILTNAMKRENLLDEQRRKKKLQQTNQREKNEEKRKKKRTSFFIPFSKVFFLFCRVEKKKVFIELIQCSPIVSLLVFFIVTNGDLASKILENRRFSSCCFNREKNVVFFYFHQVFSRLKNSFGRSQIDQRRNLDQTNFSFSLRQRWLNKKQDFSRWIRFRFLVFRSANRRKIDVAPIVSWENNDKSNRQFSLVHGKYSKAISDRFISKSRSCRGKKVLTSTEWTRPVEIRHLTLTGNREHDSTRKTKFNYSQQIIWSSIELQLIRRFQFSLWDILESIISILRD